MTPYYEDDAVTIYHGDCRDILPGLNADVLVTDPPYGHAYETGRPRLAGNARSIANDADLAVRDFIIDWWASRGPALVFGSWRRPKPVGTKGVLVWDKGGALGMGDLSVPWKFDHEEIYVIGGPFEGRRDSGSVLRCPPVQSMGRVHPNEKPVALISMLLAKMPDGVVLDPCMGSGPVLRAAKDRGRHSIGIELDERYCEMAALRMGQEVLALRLIDRDCLRTSRTWPVGSAWRFPLGLARAVSGGSRGRGVTPTRQRACGRIARPSSTQRRGATPTNRASSSRGTRDSSASWSASPTPMHPFPVLLGMA